MAKTAAPKKPLPAVGKVPTRDDKQRQTQSGRSGPKSLPSARSSYEWHAFTLPGIPVTFSAWWLLIVFIAKDQPHRLTIAAAGPAMSVVMALFGLGLKPYLQPGTLSWLLDE